MQPRLRLITGFLDDSYCSETKFIVKFHTALREFHLISQFQEGIKIPLAALGLLESRTFAVKIDL